MAPPSCRIGAGFLLFTLAACDGRQDAPVALQQALTAPPSGTVTIAEYKLPAAVDPEVLPDRATELWARVYLPPARRGHPRPAPLLVFLHGNHSTCGIGENPRVDDRSSYTLTGTCPDGYIPVPSHAGYEYVAQELAASGFLVVSINANRGINAAAGVPGDLGLNLARGRLVLKHLASLSLWDRGLEPTPASLGFSLAGRIDFAHVGLMGHSRGGEGVRAAYAQLRDPGSPWPERIPGLHLEGIFEIGPVDGQTGRVLNATDLAWTVLLPMCDGDVSTLTGVKPFDRMMAVLDESPPTPKATFTVWGANHNYFNSEWQVSDSPGCRGHTPLFTSGPGVTGSAAQRQVGAVAMSTFFRGHVGPGCVPGRDPLFDPLTPLPAALTDITRVDRGFTPSPDTDVSLRLEDFVNPGGTSTAGLPNDASEVDVIHAAVPEHDRSLRAALVGWSTAGTGTFFQTNFSPPGAGLSLRGYATLDLRVERGPSPLNPPEPTSFSVQLVHADGSLSGPLDIADFVDLQGPVGGPARIHTMLQTARLPLCEFPGANLEAVRGVRFTFDHTASGFIVLANIRATRQGRRGGPRHRQTITPGGGPAVAPQIVTAGNQVETVPRAPAIAARAAAPDVQLALRSDVPFEVRDELPVLQIGSKEILLSEHDPEDPKRIVFTLSPQDLAEVHDGDPVVVRYGPDSLVQWDFGPLDRSKLGQP
jgi:hypothetical protein